MYTEVQEVSNAVPAEKLYGSLGDAIHRARQRLAENVNMSPSSTEEALVLLDLADDARRNERFERAYRHYEKALGLLWSFA
jgi:hypothetical protein